MSNETNNYSPNNYNPNNYNVPNNYNPAAYNIPEKYQPISAWGYLGYQLLFSIPLAGIIVMLVFAFSGSTNKNVQNFARYNLIIIILVFVLYLILFLLLGAMGLSFAEYMQ